MFHPQTTEIKPFKAECFSTKTFKFQKYEGIIYDVSVDFRTLFGLWNFLAMSYPCEKFNHDMAINDGIDGIFHIFCFVYCWTNYRGLSVINDVIISSVINFMHIFFNI